MAIPTSFSVCSLATGLVRLEADLALKLTEDVLYAVMRDFRSVAEEEPNPKAMETARALANSAQIIADYAAERAKEEKR